MRPREKSIKENMRQNPSSQLGEPNVLLHPYELDTFKMLTMYGDGLQFRYAVYDGGVVDACGRGEPMFAVYAVLLFTPPIAVLN